MRSVAMGCGGVAFKGFDIDLNCSHGFAFG